MAADQTCRRHIAQIHEGPSSRAWHLRANGHRQITPATVTAAGAGDDDMIATVGQQMNSGAGGVDPEHRMTASRVGDGPGLLSSSFRPTGGGLGNRSCNSKSRPSNGQARNRRGIGEFRKRCRAPASSFLDDAP